MNFDYDLIIYLNKGQLREINVLNEHDFVIKVTDAMQSDRNITITGDYYDTSNQLKYRATLLKVLGIGKNDAVDKVFLHTASGVVWVRFLDE